MSDSLTKEKINVDTKVQEAEVYYSMGLFVESLQAYEQILLDVPELDAYKQIEIREKVGALKNKIKDQQSDGPEPPPELSIEEPSVPKKVMTSRENTSETLDSASAYRKLSLFKEAAEKYEQLLESDYPPEKIFPDLSECLFSLYSPSAVAERVETMINRNNIDEKKASRIKFMLGLEMERREHHDLSLVLYKSAMEMNPHDTEIRSRIDAIMLDDPLQSETDISEIPSDDLEVTDGEDRINQEMIDLSAPLGNELSSEEIEMDFDLISDISPDTEDVVAGTEVEKTTETVLDLEDKFNVGLDLERDGTEETEENEDVQITLDPETETGMELGVDQEVEEEEVESVEGGLEVKSVPERQETEVGSDQGSDRVTELMSQILVDAYRKEASHIHIEPNLDSQSAGVRFRLDGVCRDYLELPCSMAQEILRRLKAGADLNVEESQIPQDGKLKFEDNGIPMLDLQLATIPTIGRIEDAVIQILRRTEAMELDHIGLSEMNLKTMQRILARPHGLMLVVGQDGSGKTTSLHSALARLKEQGPKIWTVEDPIEIVQTGLRQVEAQPEIGLDVQRMIQSVLSADGDVIMIGDMEDNGTASMAIEASMAGHLVLSAIRTEGTPETISTLLNMGLSALNISHVLLGVLAQRLVRRLCAHCREAYHPSRDDFDEMVSYCGNGSVELDLSPDLTLYRPIGCDECSHSGYKGRIGIHEFMENTPQIKRLIREQASETELFEQAIKDGMIPMTQDGVNKVFNGVTDMDEVRRVCAV